MKRTERDNARRLRKKGKSINEIVTELGVAKSSVSLWVRSIKLTKSQKQRLSRRGRSVGSIELRRQNRLNNEKLKRLVFYNAGIESIRTVTEESLLFLGLGLYWGEGSKTSRGSVKFTNADPQTIQVMIRFFVDVCQIQSSRLRANISIHPHLNVARAEKYWSKISGLPLSQFTKTVMQVSRVSKGKKDTLPYGTLNIAVHDTTFFLRLMGKLHGAYAKLVPFSRQVKAKYEDYL